MNSSEINHLIAETFPHEPNVNLSPLFELSQLYASYVERRGLSLASAGNPPWGIYNSPLQTIEAGYEIGLGNGGIERNIRQLAETAERGIAIVVIGSDDNPLKDVMDQVNATGRKVSVITVGLQPFKGDFPQAPKGETEAELRRRYYKSDEELRQDRENGWYAVHGTLGDPDTFAEVWSTLYELASKGYIDKTEASALITHMVGGWDNIPSSYNLDIILDYIASMSRVDEGLLTQEEHRRALEIKRELNAMAPTSSEREKLINSYEYFMVASFAALLNLERCFAAFEIPYGIARKVEKIRGITHDPEKGVIDKISDEHTYAVFLLYSDYHIAGRGVVTTS